MEQQPTQVERASVLGKRAMDTTTSSASLPPTAPSSTMQHKADYSSSCVPSTSPPLFKHIGILPLSDSPVHGDQTSRRPLGIPKTALGRFIRRTGHRAYSQCSCLPPHSESRVTRAVIEPVCSARRTQRPRSLTRSGERTLRKGVGVGLFDANSREVPLTTLRMHRHAPPAHRNVRKVPT